MDFCRGAQLIGLIGPSFYELVDLRYYFGAADHGRDIWILPRLLVFAQFTGVRFN
jgi:ABC-type antimicrobial peptide transport system permease subunit